jgi:hypothetical protein
MTTAFDAQYFPLADVAHRVLDLRIDGILVLYTKLSLDAPFMC